MVRPCEGKLRLWLLGGIGIGTLIGFICAPLASKSMRRQITKTAVQARDSMAEGGQAICDKSRELAKDTGKLVARARKLAAKV